MDEWDLIYTQLWVTTPREIMDKSEMDEQDLQWEKEHIIPLRKAVEKLRIKLDFVK